MRIYAAAKIIVGIDVPDSLTPAAIREIKDKCETELNLSIDNMEFCGELKESEVYYESNNHDFLPRDFMYVKHRLDDIMDENPDGGAEE